MSTCSLSFVCEQVVLRQQKKYSAILCLLDAFPVNRVSKSNVDYKEDEDRLELRSTRLSRSEERGRSSAAKNITDLNLPTSRGEKMAFRTLEDTHLYVVCLESIDLDQVGALGGSVITTWYFFLLSFKFDGTIFSTHASLSLFSSLQVHRGFRFFCLCQRRDRRHPRASVLRGARIGGDDGVPEFRRFSGGRCS